MEEIKIEKSFSELSRQVREFPDELKALEDKISQMRALLDEVNRLTAALVDKLCAAVESEQIEGVRQANTQRYRHPTHQSRWNKSRV